MSVLSAEQRLHVLAALVDGNSERAVEKMTGVSRPSIGKFALTLGRAAQWLHNTMAHDLSFSCIESDEIWSYVGKKQARVTPQEHNAGLGEAYTFVGLAMPSRYVVTWHVGKRDQESTDAFIADMRARLVLMPKLATDGFAAYPAPIGKHFGYGVDYGQVVKNYKRKGRMDDDHRYEPPRDPFITKKVVFGAPDCFTTSHIERNNGTMRHKIGRMRRLCYAFSKSPAHHRAAVALGYCTYNLCHTLRTTDISPALAAQVTDHVWELPELLDALLSVPETATPTKKPLVIPVPASTSRPLPNGRGHLRVVGASTGSPAPAAPPAPPPPTAPAVPAAASNGPVFSTAPGVDPRQLDLLAWTPPPPRAPSMRLPPTQLGLFGIDFDPEPKK
jgi:hypothetical protein